MKYNYFFGKVRDIDLIKFKNLRSTKTGHAIAVTFIIQQCL